MGSYSIGEALNLLLEKSQWKAKVHAARLTTEWEQITGKTIARYTKGVNIEGKTLIIYTDVAALKQELQFGKELLIERINEYFGEEVVNAIAIR